jgi:hypothetical protein
MKKTLRFLALAALVGTAAIWLATGANHGWTKTKIAVKKLDEVTGIEGIEYQKRFVPGVDFLGAALLGAGVLTGISLLFRKQPNRH